METQKAEYKGQTLRYYTSDGELLLNTIDFCRIADLPTTANGNDLNNPRIEVTTAVSKAGTYNNEFANWLSIYFSRYKK